MAAIMKTPKEHIGSKRLGTSDLNIYLMLSCTFVTPRNLELSWPRVPSNFRDPAYPRKIEEEVLILIFYFTKKSACDYY